MGLSQNDLYYSLAMHRFSLRSLQIAMAMDQPVISFEHLICLFSIIKVYTHSEAYTLYIQQLSDKYSTKLAIQITYSVTHDKIKLKQSQIIDECKHKNPQADRISQLMKF